MGIFGGDGTHDDQLRLEARVKTLEDQVARLWAVVNGHAQGEDVPAPPSAWDAEARILKRQGKAIAAIKLVREQTGWGLREAKEHVDRLV